MTFFTYFSGLIYTPNSCLNIQEGTFMKNTFRILFVPCSCLGKPVSECHFFASFSVDLALWPNSGHFSNFSDISAKSHPFYSISRARNVKKLHFSEGPECHCKRRGRKSSPLFWPYLCHFLVPGAVKRVFGPWCSKTGVLTPGSVKRFIGACAVVGGCACAVVGEWWTRVHAYTGVYGVYTCPCTRVPVGTSWSATVPVHRVPYTRGVHPCTKVAHQAR